MLSNEEFKVYDFQASKAIKNRLGRAVPVPATRDEYSPELKKHDDEALAIHDEPKKPDSRAVKAAKFIGLLD